MVAIGIQERSELVSQTPDIDDAASGDGVFDLSVGYGIGRSTLDAAYADRAETGFPEKAAWHRPSPPGKPRADRDRRSRP